MKSSLREEKPCSSEGKVEQVILAEAVRMSWALLSRAALEVLCQV